MIKFTVPGKPQGKQRVRVTIRGGYARAYTPEQTASYENLIKLSYNSAEPPTERAVRLWVNIYYQIPKSFSKIKRVDALAQLLRPCVKPDADNVIKCVCDALNGIAYKDDVQIIGINAEKYYSDNPRLEICIATE